jgi:hypothetical protein
MQRMGPLFISESGFEPGSSFLVRSVVRCPWCGAGCGVQSAECRVQSAACGVRTAEGRPLRADR